MSTHLAQAQINNTVLNELQTKTVEINK